VTRGEEFAKQVEELTGCNVLAAAFDETVCAVLQGQPNQVAQIEEYGIVVKPGDKPLVFVRLTVPHQLATSYIDILTAGLRTLGFEAGEVRRALRRSIKVKRMHPEFDSEAA
jgi:hypothetical protein